MSDSIQESLAASVLRLGNECRDLGISNAVLRQENEELHRDYESLADEHTKLRDSHASLKAEVERLRKAGDAVCESPYLLETDPAVIAWRAAKEGKQP